MISRIVLLVLLVVLPGSCCTTSLQQLSLHRDEYGITTISGGTLEEVWHAIGYTVARDALFQLFLYTQEANGKLASLFGRDFVQNDILQHALSYNDDELLEQFSLLSEQTKKNVISWVRGIQQRINEVNAQPDLMPYECKILKIEVLPVYTLPELLRTGLLLLREFAEASVPFFQLKNYVTAMRLIHKVGSVQQGLAIFNDLVPSYVKTNNTIVPHKDENYYIPYDVTDAIVSPFDNRVINKLEAFLLVLEKSKAHKLALGLTHKLGSYGVAVGKEKSLTGHPLLLAGPQMNFNFPDDLFEIRVDNPQNNFKAHFFTVPGLPLVPIGIFNNYMTTLQVAFDVLANDFLIEPAKHKKLLKSVIIEVKNEQPQEIDIYRSSSGGWVVASLTDDTILTLRSVFFGKQLRYLDGLMKGAQAKNWGEYLSIISNPAHSSDLLVFLSQYVDKDTIAALHMGLWTELSPYVDRRFPLGTPFNPTTTYDESAIRLPLYDVNCTQGFYASWNNPFRSDLPLFTSGIPNKGSKVYWILDYLASKEQLSFDDLHELISHIATANFLSVHDGKIAFSNNFGADMFVPLFKKKFFEIINKHPTPLRLQALHFLENYRGTWLASSDIVSCRDINDQWILANQWLLLALKGMFQDVIPSCIFESSCHTSTTYLSLTLLHITYALARIIGTDNYNNFHNFNWPELDNFEAIVTTALDQALQQLGGFETLSWGALKRPFHEYKNPVLGTVHTMLGRNRASVHFIGEIHGNDVITFGVSKPLGQSGTVLGIPLQPQFDVNCFDQAQIYEAQQLRKMDFFVS